MSQDWYLMNTNYDAVGGFESEDFDNFSKDAFEEATYSSVGISVEICNYDLSQRTPLRVIIESRTQDTKLNALQRKILAPIGSCKAGQYVYYDNRYWLIVGIVDNNGIFEKGVMIICNHLLTWKNSKGNIVQRWANVSSASQYNNGESTTSYYFYKTDQTLVLTPDDDESLTIPHRQRFIIDKRCKVYEKNMPVGTIKDTSNPLTTYAMTRIDTVFYDYQDSGHSQFMVYQCEQHEDDGYYVIDGKGYWLCEEPDKQEILQEYTASIECEAPILYNGLEPTKFTAKLIGSLGEEVSDINYFWEINCDFIDKLSVEYVDDSIYISVNDRKLINKSFELSLHTENYGTTSIEVVIKAFI